VHSLDLNSAELHYSKCITDQLSYERLQVTPGQMTMASKSRHQGTDASSVTSPVLDEERVRPGHCLLFP